MSLVVLAVYRKNDLLSIEVLSRPAHSRPAIAVDLTHFKDATVRKGVP